MLPTLPDGRISLSDSGDLTLNIEQSILIQKVTSFLDNDK